MSAFAASGSDFALVTSTHIDVALAAELPHFVGCSPAGSRFGARIYDQDGVDVPHLAFKVCDHPK